jgi:hypothetical protein
MADANLSGLYREFLYSGRPVFQVSRLDREVLTSSDHAHEPVTLSSATKEVLYKDPVRLSVSHIDREFLTTTQPAKNPVTYSQFSREVLYKQAAISFYQQSREFLVHYDQLPTIHAQALQAVGRVFQKANWPTIANTISTETVLQSAQMALRHDPLSFPISYEYDKQTLMKVLQAYPIDPTVGTVLAAQYVMKVLQSDDQGHESVSMDYVKTLAMYSLYAEPLPMYTSPASVKTLGVTVLQKSPMGFLPHSTTEARQSVFMALQERDEEFQPHSTTSVVQVFQSELYPFTQPIPSQGTNEVANEFEVVLQAAPVPAAQSNNLVKQAVSLALVYTGEPLPISTERVPSYVQKVLQNSAYPHPGDMTGVYLYQNRMNVLLADTGYDNPDIMRSTARYASMREVVLYDTPMSFGWSNTQVGSAGLEWLLSVDMPSPGDMLPPSRSALVPSVAHQTLQVKPTPFEQSVTRSKQSALMALQYSFYESPEDIYNRGLFASLVAEQRASVSQFPDPSDMNSPARVYVVSEQLAEFDDGFHDPSGDTQPGEVGQVAEQVAIIDDFADPTAPASDLLAGLIGEQLAAGTSYPDPTVPQSMAQVWTTAEQVAATGTFPDPADMMSPASSTQVSEQVAQVSGFFDPTKPASTVQVTLIRHMYAQADSSLYGVPEYAIKHRPIITVNIVYSRET